MGLPSAFLNCHDPAFLRSFIALVLLSSSLARGDTNRWTKPASGYWEERAYWSLGVLPDSTQSVTFSNPGWKALAIGATTAQNFPESMRIQALEIDSPAESFNVLFMNFSGFDRPLQATSVLVGSNSAVVMQSSALEVIRASADLNTGNLLVGGTFNQGDYSQVRVERQLDVGRGTHGAYFLTNGTLSAESEVIEGFGVSGKFTQYGGFNSAGSLSIFTDGAFDMYGGQLTVTNGIIIGPGEFLDPPTLSQYGGNVGADVVVNGRYYLYSGLITGKMSVVLPTYRQVDAAVVQAGGTNSAVSLDLGNPNRFGGRGFYTLSNGVLRVDSSLTFRGGVFVQYAGLNTIRSNLLMLGTDIGLGFAPAEYNLRGGTLSVAGLTARAAYFQQDGGTNLIAGELTLIAGPPSPSGAPQVALYTLADGFLSARSAIVNALFNGGFRRARWSNARGLLLYARRGHTGREGH